jgi:hypothetical protein
MPPCPKPHSQRIAAVCGTGRPWARLSSPAELISSAPATVRGNVHALAAVGHVGRAQTSIAAYQRAYRFSVEETCIDPLPKWKRTDAGPDAFRYLSDITTLSPIS